MTPGTTITVVVGAGGPGGGGGGETHPTLSDPGDDGQAGSSGLVTIEPDASPTGIYLSGVNLTNDAEDDLALLLQADDGSEWAFYLSALTGSGGDSSQPYQWGTSVLGLSTSQVAAMVTTLREGTGKAVLVDSTHDRIDVDNRTLLAQDNIVEIEATRITDVDVDGVATEIGTGSGWSWHAPTQELREDAPSSPAPTQITVDYDGRYIIRETSGGAPHVDWVEVNAGLPLPADAESYARRLLTRHSTESETLLAKMVAGAGIAFNEGDGAVLTQDLIDVVPSLDGVTPTTIWFIDRVEIAPDGQSDDLIYSMRLVRRHAESRYRDDWLTAFDRTVEGR